MGTFSEKILGSDNALDVYEDYFLLYNEGKDINEISIYILDKYFTSEIDIVERSEYLSAFLKAKWETKSLGLSELNKLKELVENQKLYQLLSDFGASEKFIKTRKKELILFITKISVERSKVKLRKKPPTKLISQFKNGSCFSFKYNSEEFGGIVVIQNELFTTKGGFMFALTTIRQPTEPTVSDFLNSTFDRCKWNDPIEGEGKNYKITGIDAYSVYYLTKKERILYFEGLETFFTYIGTIKPFKSGFHCSSGIDLSEIHKYEQVLSNEMEYACSEERKKIHLEVYKEELKPDTVKLKDFYLLTKRDC